MASARGRGRLIPIDQVVESNVVFKDPEPVVMARWSQVIAHAFEPAALFARFRHNITSTYANRLPLPLSRFGFSWNLIRNGVFAMLSVIFYLGILARYRGHFWRMLLAALRSGQLDAMIYVATGAYHFIRFRDDVLAGARRSASTPRPPAPSAKSCVPCDPAIATAQPSFGWRSSEERSPMFSIREDKACPHPSPSPARPTCQVVRRFASASGQRQGPPVCRLWARPWPSASRGICRSWSRLTAAMAIWWAFALGRKVPIWSSSQP